MFSEPAQIPTDNSNHRSCGSRHSGPLARIYFQTPFALFSRELASHLQFVDLGGHGYAQVRFTAEEMRTEFVWRTAVLVREVLEGDPGIGQVAGSRPLFRNSQDA